MKKLGIDVLAVPLPSNCGNEEYKHHLIEALTVLQKEIKRDLNNSSPKVTGQVNFLTRLFTLREVG